MRYKLVSEKSQEGKIDTNVFFEHEGEYVNANEFPVCSIFMGRIFGVEIKLNEEQFAKEKGLTKLIAEYVH